MSTRRKLCEVDARALVSSAKWLRCHGLQRKKLTLLQILAQLGFQQKEGYVNNLGRPVSSRYGHGLFRQYNSDGKIYNLTAKKEQVQQKEECVTDVIELYKQRLEWLTSGSRQVFGVIQEQSVVLVLDLGAVSKVQYDLCRDALCLVLREQVAHISKFNIIWASQEPVKWQQEVVHVTQHSIEAAVEWVWNLQHPPAVNSDSAAEAVSKALGDKVEAVSYFAAGDIPEDRKQLMLKRLSKSPRPIHTVSYHAQREETRAFLKELSHQTAGRFHAYSERNKHLGMQLTQDGDNHSMQKTMKEKTSPEADVREDEYLIWKELDEAQNTLTQIQDILKACYHPEDENNSNCPVLEVKLEDCVSSKEWLKKYGLKPQKLQFYDALADCAFRHSDGVVDIKTKPEDVSVQTDAEKKMKLINAKYCDRFVHAHWKDGSVVHVYITKEKCRGYEETMKTALEQMDRRIKWLQQGSRELFGTILEDQVYILIDTSHSMKNKLFLVKEKICQLMQEQLRHKRMFNFVKFDSRVEAWKEKLSEVNEEKLKEAWFWVKELQVGNSTNTLRALQVALADNKTQAVYLLTDGRPDQPSNTILAQVNVQNPVPVHSISFNCDDTEANSFLYQLSSETGGRFHCYSSYLQDPEAPQPFVSEDIQLLLNEIEQGKTDLEKMQKLHTECLMLDWYHNGDKDISHMPVQTQNQKPHEVPSASLLRHRERISATQFLHRKKALHAEQTKSSLLRALSRGVRLCDSEAEVQMLPETRALFLSNGMKTATVLKELNIVDDTTSPKKAKRAPKDCLDISSSRWLKTHGLVSRRLTIMDALAPTTVPHTAKYVPILDKHVLSKVFDEVLPLAHVSGDRKLITLINPQAVNLNQYKQKLAHAIKSYEKRLNVIVWRALSQEARDKFESDKPISYWENKEALLQALDTLGWPISSEDVMLLEDEIEAGNTYFHQALELQQTTKSELQATRDSSEGESNKAEVKEQRPNVKQRRTMLDTLRGQKVIARSDVDGFYYKGTVVRSIHYKRAIVDFCQGDTQIIPIRFIIQTGGALPCPFLKVGDFVFAKTGARTGSGCYVPAVVIATPRTGAADKLYSVLKYNNRKENSLRNELIKISQSQFAFSCRYIREAQMVDYSIPNVQMVKPITKPTPPLKEKKRRKEKGKSSRSEEKLIKEKTNIENQCVIFRRPKDRHSSGDRESKEEEKVPYYDEVETVSPRASCSPIPDGSVSAVPHSSMSAMPTLPKTSAPRSSAADRKLSGTNMSEKLESLALQLTQYQMEYKEQQQTVQGYLQKLALLKSHQDNCGLEEKRKELEKQQVDLLQQLKMLTPIHNILDEMDDLHKDLGPANKSKKRKAYGCQLVPGQKVLSRCSHSGWYGEGSIVHDCGDFTYFVQNATGETARIWREDIFSDADDSGKEITEEDPVIGPHPLHCGCYCPGVVLKVMPGLNLVIQYYDHVEALVPREQVYSTSPEKFERDIAYIRKCEERWVGQPVVARNDETGTFHLAEVQKRVGNGKLFVVCWADGRTIVQDIAWIFGKFSQAHVLKVGDHILTLAHPSSLTFLPGVITGQNGTTLQIRFCNSKSCQRVEPHHCFGLSEDKFNMAVHFYSQQKQSREVYEDDATSDNEDSLSDISSVTITSIDSEKLSQIGD